MRINQPVDQTSIFKMAIYSHLRSLFRLWSQAPATPSTFHARLHQQYHLRIRHKRITPLKIQTLRILELSLEVLNQIYRYKLLNIRNMPTTRTGSPSVSLTDHYCSEAHLPYISRHAPKRPFHSGVNKRSVFVQKSGRIELLMLWIKRLIAHETMLVKFYQISCRDLVTIRELKRLHGHSMGSVSLKAVRAPGLHSEGFQHWGLS